MVKGGECMSRRQVHYLPKTITALPEYTNLIMHKNWYFSVTCTHLPETTIGLCII